MGSTMRSEMQSKFANITNWDGDPDASDCDDLDAEIARLQKLRQIRELKAELHIRSPGIVSSTPNKNI